MNTRNILTMLGALLLTATLAAPSFAGNGKGSMGGSSSMGGSTSVIGSTSKGGGTSIGGGICVDPDSASQVRSQAGGSVNTALGTSVRARVRARLIQDGDGAGSLQRLRTQTRTQEEVVAVVPTEEDATPE